MSVFIECQIEGLAHQSGIDFVSVKAKPDGDSQLVLNPNMFPEVDAYMSEPADSVMSKAGLEHLCQQCGGCKSKISPDGQGFRVDRRGYSFDEVRKPLFITKQFAVQHPSSDTRRVCIIDDSYAQIQAENLSERHTVLMVNVNGYVRPDFQKLNQLRHEVASFRPDCVVSDKGLGFIDGIELIQSFRDMGIRTIMYTGEIQTDETRRVADVFIIKPAFEQVEAAIVSA